MKPAFSIICRNKAQHVSRAVSGALQQTQPCEIILSDQHSTDGSLEVMKQTVEQFGPTDHIVRILECPIEGSYGMKAANEHFDWVVKQTEADWIFQTSADDYSLKDRVKVCMDAVMRNKASAVATTMFFETPGVEQKMQSGYPTTTGYVQAGEGLLRLAYGSVIAAYHRKFLEKVGSAGQSTMDVFYGFLAALDYGFYVVCDPQHVHVAHADVNNTGFGGKLRAEMPEDERDKLNELNRFQLCELYYHTAMRQQELYPMAHNGHQVAVRQMMMDQAVGWLHERQKLHDKKIIPGII